MKTISTAELKAKMDQGDPFKLVMTYSEEAFNKKHIPGSINIYSLSSAEGKIEREDDIVVYCTNVRCTASIAAYSILENMGFNNVRRYAGGLMEWEQAGLPVEGQHIHHTKL